MSVLLKLSWVFLKIGTVCFGGGLVIVPMVETEVVTNYGWLTRQEFVDAVTLGQITPGPVVISATFIGYKVMGILGAIVATASVILPSFLMICFATMAIAKFRSNKVLAAFLRGARIAVIGMVFQAALSIGKTSIVSYPTVLIALVSLILLYQYKLNPMWIFIGAGVMGLLV